MSMVTYLIDYFQNTSVDVECTKVTIEKFREWLYEIDLTKMTGVQQMVDEASVIYIVTA